jgi:hypothetical protein
LDDLSAADWLLGTDADALRLITFGPAAFEAYGRLRYIPDPDAPGVAEADALVPDGHPSDIEQARIALRALAEHTRSSAQCFFCVWIGYGWSFSGQDLAGGPLLVLPGREYALFTGDLGEINQWEKDFGGGEPCSPPAFVWPTDHAWCFTSDVDPHWAGIGATSGTIESLIVRTDVDVVTASPDQAPLAYG